MVLAVTNSSSALMAIEVASSGRHVDGCRGGQQQSLTITWLPLEPGSVYKTRANLSLCVRMQC